MQTTTINHNTNNIRNSTRLSTTMLLIHMLKFLTKYHHLLIFDRLHHPCSTMAILLYLNISSLDRNFLLLFQLLISNHCNRKLPHQRTLHKLYLYL